MGMAVCSTGSCHGVLHAAGYTISCTNSSKFFDKTSRLVNETAADGTSAFADAVVFGTGLSYGDKSGWFEEGEAVMNLTVIVKTETGCSGTLAVTTCAMVPATVGYHVVVSNGSVQLDKGYGYEGDTVVGYYRTPSSGSGVHHSYHGGFALAMREILGSSVTLSFAGTAGMRMVTEGVTAMRYQRRREKGPGEFGYAECDNYWLDPTRDLLMMMREVAFRLALQGEGQGGPVPVQDMLVEEKVTEVVYASDYLFLWLAVGVIGLSVLTVSPLLHGWWRLGREVSLSPMEVARAFGAPALRGSGSNSDTGQLMKEIGAKKVSYGEMTMGESSQFARELSFGEPGVVHRPQKGVAYV